MGFKFKIPNYKWLIALPVLTQGFLWASGSDLDKRWKQAGLDFEREIYEAKLPSMPPMPRPAPAGMDSFDPRWRTESQLKGLRESPRQGTLKFAVLGDSRQERFFKPVYPDNRNFELFLDKMGTMRLDFSMHLGDFVKTGTEEQYLELLQTLGERVSWPFLTTIGNHEVKKDPAGLNYRLAFGDEDYFYDYKGVRFVVAATKSEKDSLTATQIEWLRTALDTSLPKIVFTHMPPKALSNFSSSDLGKVLGRTFGGGFEGESEAFTDLMKEAGVLRVYVGHLHGFGVADHKGVRYVLTGGGGSPLYHWRAVPYRFFNFIEVEIAPDGKLKEWVHRLEGERVPIEDFPVLPAFSSVKGGK